MTNDSEDLSPMVPNNGNHLEARNNVSSKPFHDPWTRNGSMKDQESLLFTNTGGKIYKGAKRQGSTSSSLHPSVAKRKASVYHHEPHAGSAGFAISVFNNMNAVLGSGILGLPYAMAQLGIGLFFIFEVIVAFLALYAIHLLLKMCDQTGVKAYEKLGFIAFGLPGRIVAAVCILMQNIGAMCSYLFIVKYELPNVIMTLTGMIEPDGSWYTNGDILVVVVTCCVILPLASLKNIGFLGYTSGFSISCMFFFTAVVIAKKFSIICPLFDQSIYENYTHGETYNSSVEHDTYDMNSHSNVTEQPTLTEAVNSTLETIFETVTALSYNSITSTTNGSDGIESMEHILTLEEERGYKLYEEFGPQQCEPAIFGVTDKWVYSVPTMTFSFVCHTAILPIYAELKSPSPKRMQNIATTSVSICFVLYSLSAVFGYLTFYNWMEPELLLMYSYADSGDIMTLVVRLCVLTAVVLTVPLTHFPARKAVTFLLFPNKDFSWYRHFGIMIGLLTLVNLFVVFVPTIREVFGIIGATASTMLVFIMPCLFFVRIDESPTKSPQKIGAIALCIAGILFMIQSLTVIILGYVS